jgi:hypothetical protein
MTNFFVITAAVILCIMVWMIQKDFCERSGGHYTLVKTNWQMMCLTKDGRVVQ